MNNKISKKKYLFKIRKKNIKIDKPNRKPMNNLFVILMSKLSLQIIELIENF